MDLLCLILSTAFGEKQFCETYQQSLELVPQDIAEARTEPA